MIKVSAILSIHNRSKLFRRALDGYLNQSMSPAEWEIVLVDDMSTEDMSKTYEHLIGEINLLHVRMDHTRHAVFSEMNPGWHPASPKNWYHTPAISTNIGCAAARGSVLCLCHPEILHAPDNFSQAYSLLSLRNLFLFGKTYLGSLRHNSWLDSNSWTHQGGWDSFIRQMNIVEHLSAFEPYELYWYTSFLQRSVAERVGGVDFEYLRGVAAEDDDFKERVRRAGWPPFYMESVAGFHQDHSDETEQHRQRNTTAWKDGLARNRATFYGKKKEDSFAQVANTHTDWKARECIVSVTRYSLGTMVAETLSG